MSFKPSISKLLHARFIWAMAGLLALLFLNVFFGKNFFNVEMRDGHLYGTLVDILNQGSKVMLLALGMTLVIATGGVDLSVGSIMAIAGAMAAVLIQKTQWPFAMVLAAVLGTATLAGLFNGFLISVAGIQPIVATLILMVAGRGIAMLLTGGQIITFEHPAFVYLGNGHLAGLPFTLFIVAAVVCVTALFLRRTAAGLLLEATGDNETAARFSGVGTTRLRQLVYGFSGFCAGCAGLIATSNIKAADSSRVGEMMELDAIFAVVVGGTALTGGRFTLAGSLFGALLMQTLTVTMYNLGVPPAAAPVPKAIVIVGVCLMQSDAFRRQIMGIFGIRKGAATA